VSFAKIKKLIQIQSFSQTGQSTREAELGARLSCYLLLMLFQSVEGSVANPARTSYASGIKHSCDRQLLASSIRNVTIGLIIGVLKVGKYFLIVEESHHLELIL
jgi:hypothetical protein